MHEIYPIDLNFQGQPKTIAAYLIKHKSGGLLVECGPGSTIAALVSGLQDYGLKPSDITDVLLTHIHLDHAGAAGWLASQGARVHVHSVGAPHLIDPEKLLASARRIYQDQMDVLWGEFLPVPESQISVHNDMDEIAVSDLRFQAVDTPGHASHHFVYLFEDVCFSGDIGGIRMPGTPHVRIPMPPPEFHLEQWRASVEILRKLPFKRIAPTHYSIYSDRAWHLDTLSAALDEAEVLIERLMPQQLSIADLQKELMKWAEEQSVSEGLETDTLDAMELANPTWMSAAGIQRYWNKYRVMPGD